MYRSETERIHIHAHARTRIAPQHQGSKRDDSSVLRPEESSAPRFIGLLPILSHAQNAAKHIVAVYVCVFVSAYVCVYVYARPELDNEALPPR